MSGNSIHVGMAAGKLDPPTLLRFGCAIMAYLLALILTRIALEAGARVRWRRIASVTLAVEASLLLAFIFVATSLHQGRAANFNSPLHLGMVALLAFAMGMQTGTLTHLGPLTVYTTFVTGTLTKFAESASRLFFWMHDAIRSGTRLSRVLRDMPRNQDAVSGVFLLGVWLSYVVGAALGTLTMGRWELRALYFPIGVLLGLIALDLGHPIAAGEEQRQLEGKPHLGAPA
jgi:uncharacterized membrane protein YoaK (UPF0700 family)